MILAIPLSSLFLLVIGLAAFCADRPARTRA